MKCIAVDDEPFALDLIKGYIEKTPFLELTGAFSNPLKALSYLMTNRVDLIFLDINMPELSGLQLLNSLQHQPRIVFTTAYSEYGAESYDYNATDYLLKPIKYERFLKAVNKAFNELGKNNSEQAITEDNLDQINALFLKSGSHVHKVLPDDIYFLEGTGNYITFHTSTKKIVSLCTMKKILQQLPNDCFVRIHKSYVVSLKHIDIVERHQLHVKGHKLPIGITYREQFMTKYQTL